MSYRSELAVQFMNQQTIDDVTKAVDKKLNKECYTIRHPDETNPRPDGSIIYYWAWINEWDDEWNSFYDTLSSGNYTVTIVRIGEASDDAEDTMYQTKDLPKNLLDEICLERSIYMPPNWTNFKQDKFPPNKREAQWYAKDWQTWQETQNLSYEEMNNFTEYFRKIADFYNLKDEFKENGII